MYQRRRYEPKTFDLRGELYRIFGVDLTNVPGISAITAQTILCEIGTDVSRFRNASAFAPWLGLCPENKISGGKVLYTKSRRVRSRVATALRMAANSLHHAIDYLGEFFRRITRKLGKPQAITATAHKLARIVYHLLSTKEAYNETVFHRCDEEALRRAQFRLRRQAAQLGFQLIPVQTDDVPWESACVKSCLAPESGAIWNLICQFGALARTRQRRKMTRCLTVLRTAGQAIPALG